MSDPYAATATHETAHAHAHAHGHDEHISDSVFLKVFVGLLMFTAVSFGCNYLFAEKRPALNFTVIGIVACIKATLVMYFFMHLKIDWRKVFVFLIPICILAPLVIVVLWPDIVLAWRLGSPDVTP